MSATGQNRTPWAATPEARSIGAGLSDAFLKRRVYIGAGPAPPNSRLSTTQVRYDYSSFHVRLLGPPPSTHPVQHFCADAVERCCSADCDPAGRAPHCRARHRCNGGAWALTRPWTWRQRRSEACIRRPQRPSPGRCELCRHAGVLESEPGYGSPGIFVARSALR